MLCRSIGDNTAEVNRKQQATELWSTILNKDTGAKQLKSEEYLSKTGVAWRRKAFLR
jgi:hypothetical protein